MQLFGKETTKFLGCKLGVTDFSGKVKFLLQEEEEEEAIVLGV